MKIISIRVPKTASSSFGEILKQVYPRIGAPWNKFMALDLHDPKSEWYHCRGAFKARWYAEIKKACCNLDVVHGHTPVELWDGLFPEAKRICWLRNPVSFIISGYFFAKNLRHISPNMTIWDYVELPYRRNWQTMYTGGDLSRFFFVGKQENFANDVKDLAMTLRWKRFAIPKLNISVSNAYTRAKGELLSDREFINHVKFNHADDVALYKSIVRYPKGRMI